jgi:hypothetical protein
MIRRRAAGAGAGAVVLVEAGALVTATAAVFGCVAWWLLAPQPVTANAAREQAPTTPSPFLRLKSLIAHAILGESMRWGFS